MDLEFPHLADMVIEGVEQEVDRIVVFVRSSAGQVACTSCGQLSGRVHGLYRRMLRDVPCAGLAVWLGVTVRRFKCRASQCPAVTFAEPLPQVAVAYARFTVTRERWINALATALAGNAAARLSHKIAAGVSRSTLLRRVRACVLPPVGPVRVPVAPTCRPTAQSDPVHRPTAASARRHPRPAGQRVRHPGSGP